jgi:Holliday junction resolvasome RuvABC endonuclease subunit
VPALAGLPVAEYAANLVKKTVVGAGHAENGGVFGHRQAGEGRHQQGDGAGVAELQGRLRVLVDAGHAEKDQVGAMVRFLLPKATADTADAADALAIARWLAWVIAMASASAASAVSAVALGRRKRTIAPTLKLGHARAVALLVPALAGLPVAEYAANLVKKTTLVRPSCRLHRRVARSSSPFDVTVPLATKARRTRRRP